MKPRWIAPGTGFSWRLAALLVALVAFVVYARYREVTVARADGWGYDSASRFYWGDRSLFRSRFDPALYPAVVPDRFFLVQGKLASGCMPGYPLLRALARPLHLESFVNPLLGGLSVLLVYEVLARKTRSGVALLFALFWACCPIVIWASTAMMSDLAGCFFPLLAYLLLQKGRPAWASVVLGLSLFVRVSTLALLPAFVLAAMRTRRVRPFLAGLLLPIAAYGAFNWSQYGGPWTTGYGSGASGDFVASALARNLPWLTSSTWTLLTPPLLLLGLVPLLFRPREHIELALWFASLLLVYGLFAPMGREWWYTRYLLPGYPALLFLSAIGCDAVLTWLAERDGGFANYRPVLAASAVVANLYHDGAFAFRYDIFREDRHRGAFLDCVSVAKVVPPEGLVGATELSGLLRLYAHVDTFDLYKPGHFEVMDRSLDLGIPLFLVVQPWDHVEAVLQAYVIEDVTPLPSSPDIYVARVTGRIHL